MQHPRTLAAGLCACLSMTLIGLQTADARFLGGNRGPKTSTDEAAPWGSLTAASDLVLAGTHVGLTWEINIPDSIDSVANAVPVRSGSGRAVWHVVSQRALAAIVVCQIGRPVCA